MSVYGIECSFPCAAVRIYNTVVDAVTQGDDTADYVAENMVMILRRSSDNKLIRIMFKYIREALGE